MPFSKKSFGNIERIIGGCSLIIDSKLNTTYDLYLLKSTEELNKRQDTGSHDDDLGNFTFLLESTIKLICEIKYKNIFLAKSGGIDSSVLLAALQSNKIISHLFIFHMEV